MSGWYPEDFKNRDVATCKTCHKPIFRTNVDGNWHHVTTQDHEPKPTEQK